MKRVDEVIDFIAGEMEDANSWGRDFGYNIAANDLFDKEFDELTEEQGNEVFDKLDDYIRIEAEQVFEECDNWSFISSDFDVLLDKDGCIDRELLESFDETDFDNFYEFLKYLKVMTQQRALYERLKNKYHYTFEGFLIVTGYKPYARYVKD